MRRSRLALVALLSTFACGTPRTADLSRAPTESLNGSERVGWEQQAASAAELHGLHWAVYIDGARAVMADARCTETTRPAWFTCSASVPRMLPGTHTLELATFAVEDGALESARSAPILVDVPMRR